MNTSQITNIKHEHHTNNMFMLYIRYLWDIHVLYTLFVRCSCFIYVICEVFMFYIHYLWGVHVLYTLFVRCSCFIYVICEVFMFYIRYLWGVHVIYTLFVRCSCFIYFICEVCLFYINMNTSQIMYIKYEHLTNNVYKTWTPHK
jgi:hypothetical protein